MATLASLILDTERILYGQARLERPKLDTGSLADDSTTSLTGLNTNLWSAQDRAEVWPVDGSVGEIVHFTSENAGTGTVIRGMSGTTAAAASSQPLLKNPTHPRVTIQAEIENVINQDLWPHVWLHSDRTLTYVIGTKIYELNANDRHVVSMYQVVDGLRKWMPFGWWKIVQGLDSGTSSTGQAVEVEKVHAADDTVYYWSRTEITTSDYANLPADIEAAIPYMVAARLVGDYRYAKDQSDPNRQALPEVQAGQAAQTSRQLKAEFLRQRADIHRRLVFDEKNMWEYRSQNRRPTNFGFHLRSRGRIS